MPENPPRVVLGADPLFQPPTGIGNYTRSLASNLLALQLVHELTMYANGVVLTGDMLASVIESSVESTSGKTAKRGNGNTAGLLSAVRSYLASQGWTVRAYETLMPMIDRARLYPYRRSVFHSPNYLLPPFEGATVATFHDLSIQRFPQFHPKARVQLLDKGMAEVAKRASHIITDSALIRQEVMDYYHLPPDQVTAIPLAAEDRFRPRSAAECTRVLESLGLEYRGFLLFS
ncbi:MAG: glycosyltransferase, partial [Halioglobus sp.]|nr:glycosyltransferase [Halioglobus sp.]